MASTLCTDDKGMTTTLCRVRGEQQQGKETSGGRDSVYFIPSSADGYITDLHGIYTKSKKLTTGVEAIKSQHDKGDMDIAEPILARNIHSETV